MFDIDQRIYLVAMMFVDKQVGLDGAMRFHWCWFDAVENSVVLPKTDK